MSVAVISIQTGLPVLGGFQSTMVCYAEKGVGILRGASIAVEAMEDVGTLRQRNYPGSNAEETHS